jgi:hypothetical protein
LVQASQTQNEKHQREKRIKSSHALFLKPSRGELFIHTKLR